MNIEEAKVHANVKLSEENDALILENERMRVALMDIRKMLYGEPLTVLRAMHSNPILLIDTVLAHKR